MPPFIPQKRHSSNSPQLTPARKKQNVFHALDQTRKTGTVQDNKDFLNGPEENSSDSSLSDVSDSSNEDFEDVHSAPPLERQRLQGKEDEEEEFDWENAVTPAEPQQPSSSPGVLESLELTIDKGHHQSSFINLSGKKKGPSKIERQIRQNTHRMHVQFLLFHNWIRNSWACNGEIQRVLVEQLPINVKQEVERWRVSSGLQAKAEVKEARTPKARKTRKGQAQSGIDPQRQSRARSDWGAGAAINEQGVADMSHGDPIIRLLKVLAAYWRKRFVITAPALRKQGYKTLVELEEELTSFKNNEHYPELHGERISGKADFKNLGKKCEGSRDVGAQLFSALIRGLGIDARLVASLQPTGFGWNKNEEATETKKAGNHDIEMNVTSPTNELTAPPIDEANPTPARKPKAKMKTKPRPGRGAKDAPIDLSEGDGFTYTDVESEEDDASIAESTSSLRKRSGKSYNKDLQYPTYWVEAISPITHEVHPVDPLVLTPAVATNAELLANFEPRGAKADKAKQVIAYVVAYSSDGTAKDVTTRYLKRHVWPGRTKGLRMPVERIPVYNKRGKIKRHEEYDWFKIVMSGYRRADKMRTIVDDLEDAKDLKPVKIERKEVKDGGQDTLQNLKSSADFILERHLRREEALLPNATPVREFSIGKGEKAKSEPVFSRKDVVICRTAESWHKEGRGVKEGEHPMKSVPVRAVTMNRKREVEEAQRDGEKLMQGMYAWEQTDWIIPPPIENGVIPKNAYGNMDCFVPTMVPEGAVHIPLRSTMKVCKRLGIDFAEAVTGFEFGHRMAVPVITGVIVAVEHEHLVLDGWAKDEEERKRKEDAKREKAALAAWKKFLMGLRIKDRFEEEFGEDYGAHSKDEFNPFTNRNKRSSANGNEKSGLSTPVRSEAGGFLLDTDDDTKMADKEDGGGGFVIEDGNHAEITPKLAISNSENGELSSRKSKSFIEQMVNRETKALPTTKKRGRGRPSRKAVVDNAELLTPEATPD